MIEIRPKVYCEKCNEKVSFKLEGSLNTITHKDVTFTYLETRARCVNCNELVYVPEINDKNCRERHKAYYNKLFELKDSEQEAQHGIA